MKKRFTEEQIIGFLREAETGLPVAELCRRHGSLFVHRASNLHDAFQPNKYPMSTFWGLA